MPGARLLDVSRLEPPEPFVCITAALEDLAHGEYLHVRHRREPLPLYAWLDEHGYAWHARHGPDAPCEILIWRRVDARAQAAARAGGGHAAA
jgi:hypothetical protein